MFSKHASLNLPSSFCTSDRDQWPTVKLTPGHYLGSSEVLFGGRHSPILQKFQESPSKGARAAGEMVTVYSLTFFIRTAYCCYL